MISEGVGLIIGCAILMIMTIGGIWCRSYEKKLWDDGTCKDNGLPWKLFDYDSHGDHGYKAGDIHCWISYRVDK